MSGRSASSRARSNAANSTGSLIWCTREAKSHTSAAAFAFTDVGGAAGFEYIRSDVAAAEIVPMP